MNYGKRSTAAGYSVSASPGGYQGFGAGFGGYNVVAGNSSSHTQYRPLLCHGQHGTTTALRPNFGRPAKRFSSADPPFRPQTEAQAGPRPHTGSCRSAISTLLRQSTVSPLTTQHRGP